MLPPTRRPPEGGFLTKQYTCRGGGIGGTMTANSIVAKLYPEVARGAVKVTPAFGFAPALQAGLHAYVAFDMFFEGELRRKQQSLLRPGDRFPRRQGHQLRLRRLQGEDAERYKIHRLRLHQPFRPVACRHRSAFPA